MSCSRAVTKVRCRRAQGHVAGALQPDNASEVHGVHLSPKEFVSLRSAPSVFWPFEETFAIDPGVVFMRMRCPSR